MIRAVKRGATLRPFSFGGGLEMLLFLPFAFAYQAWLDRQRTYKVGVVLEPRSDVFFIRERLVRHRETLPPGVDPTDRMLALADEVRGGAFD